MLSLEHRFETGRHFLQSGGYRKDVNSMSADDMLLTLRGAVTDALSLLHSKKDLWSLVGELTIALVDVEVYDNNFLDGYEEQERRGGSGDISDCVFALISPKHFSSKLSHAIQKKLFQCNNIWLKKDWKWHCLRFTWEFL